MGQRTRAVSWLAAVALLAASCASTTAPTTAPTPVPRVTQGPQSAADLCAGSAYSRCVDSVTTATGAGWKLFAICEYPSGEGDIVLLDDPEEAETACSADGYIDVYNVFDVIELP